VYGVPPGPYLMVPIFGPYTLRDGVGEVVDTTASGFLYAPFWYQVAGLSPIETSGASVGQKGLELLNLRSIYDEELEESKKDAFDYYIFVRNAYLQNRRAKVADQTDAPVLDEEDLYFFDEEENGDEADDDEEENYDDF
ncbi:MAG: MlaA family lipoprotein, partial [bacterium]